MDEKKLRDNLLSLVNSNLVAYSKNLLFTGVVDREGHLMLPCKVTQDLEAFARGNATGMNNSLSKVADEIVNNVVKIIKEIPRGECGRTDVFCESGKGDN